MYNHVIECVAKDTEAMFIDVEDLDSDKARLEAGDTVLVLSQTLLDAENKDTSEYSMDRRATYVYRKVSDKWLCAIDNSYGTTLLD